MCPVKINLSIANDVASLIFQSMSDIWLCVQFLSGHDESYMVLGVQVSFTYRFPFVFLLTSHVHCHTGLIPIFSSK
jgi:hypothetical protein